MKRKILIIIIALLIDIALTAIFSSLVETNEQLFSVFSLGFLGIIYIGLFAFGGIVKLIIYFLYSIVIGIGMIIFLKYQMAFVIIGTLAFVLNPLSNFEKYLNSLIESPIKVHIFGVMHKYRKAMKDYYHLPQTRKLYTKKKYLLARQLSTLAMLSTAIFFFISEISSMINPFTNTSIASLLTLYGVVILFIGTNVVHKKGFQSLLRLFIVSIYPLIFYLLWISPMPFNFKVVFMIIVAVIAVTVIAYQIYLYYKRVVYAGFRYYDVDKKCHVFANSLYPDVRYNKRFNKVAVFKLNIGFEFFKQNLKNILVYANLHSFFISLYTYNGTSLEIYADFSKNKIIDKFAVFLESKLLVNVSTAISDDPDKTIYDINFYKNTEYIIASAIQQINILKELNISSYIYLGLSFSFRNIEDLLEFSKEYVTEMLEEGEKMNYFSVFIEFRLVNTDYIIERHIRDCLMNAMINKGIYNKTAILAKEGK